MNHSEIEHMLFALACLNLFHNKHLLEPLKFVKRKKCFCGLWCFLKWHIEKVHYIILVKQKASVCCLFKKGLVEQLDLVKTYEKIKVNFSVSFYCLQVFPIQVLTLCYCTVQEGGTVVGQSLCDSVS